jgi:hypothetical protein
LISIFLNIVCQTAKKFALSRVFYFVGWGRVLRGAVTKSLSSICPRNICRQQIGHNVCVSAVVPYRSRVLSHETKTLNEDKTLNQLVTAPLQKHFVSGRF